MDVNEKVADALCLWTYCTLNLSCRFADIGLGLTPPLTASISLAHWDASDSSESRTLVRQLILECWFLNTQTSFYGYNQWVDGALCCRLSWSTEGQGAAVGSELGNNTLHGRTRICACLFQFPMQGQDLPYTSKTHMHTALPSTHPILSSFTL